jgi:pimeloyl-ACP methyl ester carboxylesterase
MYAALYPQAVAGVVFVDASHPDQWAYATAEFRANAQPSPAIGPAYRAAQRVGVARLVNLLPIPAECGHPPPYCSDERAYRNGVVDMMEVHDGAPATRETGCARTLTWL